MPDTAVFQTSSGEWDIEYVPPSMRKVGTIKRRGAGFFIFALLPLSGGSTSAIHLGPHENLSDAMDAIAAGMGGRCQMHTS